MPDWDSIEPLLHSGVSDYHCHCDYSMDAVGTVDDYCQVALARNLAELCFTTHFDIPSRLETAEEEGSCIRIGGKLFPTGIEVMEPYVDDVREAHQKYYSLGLSVKLGMEFGWYQDCEEIALRLNEKYELDYLLCGVHTVDGIFIEHCHERMSAEEMAEKYFIEVLTAAKSGLFDTIAHLDYYRKIGRDAYGEIVDQVHRPYINDLFAALKASDTCLEVNTRARKFGLDEFYPRMEIVNEARSKGVAVQYLGSDAHRPEDVGFEFEMGVNVVPPYIAKDRD